MTGPGKQCEYSRGEKIVNAIAGGLIWSLKPLAWLIRAINGILPEKRERRTPNEPVKDEGLNNSRGK